jgi:flagellar basal-body rod modification protein FlgD
MTIGAITTGTAGTGSTDQTALVGNYEMFLKLLTAQIRAQNPLEPMDADQFTQQLVQYSGVEQQIKMNTSLESVLAALASQSALSLVNYVGRTVTAESSVTSREATGPARWSLTSAAPAPEATVTVRDASGAVVFSEATTLTAGSNTYEWDGKLANGSYAPAGVYSATFQASDAAGNAVAITTTVTGKVEKLDASGFEPMLQVGGIKVPISGVISVSE